MTALEAINKGAEFLERKGVDSPRLQSELLLAHLFGVPRLRLYLDFERELTAAQGETFRELLVKRGSRIPIQHLIGTTNFCGCPIEVTPAVLVPRPETEILAEAAWQFLNELGRGSTFVDVGTGSGCIAIAIATHAKQSRGLAVDISEAALAVAARNIEQNRLSERIKLRKSDLLAALQPAERFDAIVSNPPYVPTGDIELLQAEVRNHDPRLALDGGADGLNFYRALAEGAAQVVQPGGRLLVEFGDGQGEALRELFWKCGWNVHSILRDLNQAERVLVASPIISAPATN